MFNARIRRPSPATLIATIALVVAATGVATAAIPGSDGTITACADKAGNLKVIDETESCKKHDERLAWNDGSGKVRDADLLDGRDSSDYLAANGKARDTDLFDGADSSEFVRGDVGVQQVSFDLAVPTGGQTVTVRTVESFPLRVYGQCFASGAQTTIQNQPTGGDVFLGDIRFVKDVAGTVSGGTIGQNAVSSSGVSADPAHALWQGSQPGSGRSFTVVTTSTFESGTCRFNMSVTRTR